MSIQRSNGNRHLHPAKPILNLYLALTAVGALFWTVQLTGQPSESGTGQILFLKEEVKLARDVYTTLGTQWDLKAFHNIARAEQVHMDQVDTLITAYGLTDPAINEIGRFQNALLQHLFDRLTLGHFD